MRRTSSRTTAPPKQRSLTREIRTLQLTTMAPEASIHPVPAKLSLLQRREILYYALNHVKGMAHTSLFLTASVVTSYTEISDDVATFSPSAVFLVEPSDDFGFCGFSFRIAGEKKFSGSLRLLCSANVSTFVLECGLVVFSVVVVALDVALSVVVSATGTSLWVKSGSKRSFSTGACVTVVGLVVEAAVVFGVVVVVVLAVVVVVGLVVETG